MLGVQILLIQQYRIRTDWPDGFHSGDTTIMTKHFILKMFSIIIPRAKSAVEMKITLYTVVLVYVNLSYEATEHLRRGFKNVLNESITVIIPNNVRGRRARFFNVYTFIKNTYV